MDEYPDAKHQAHVMVAKRRLEAGKQDGVKAGETVPYIIALESDMSLEDIANGKAGSSGGKGLAERAFHPEEVIERGLKVDLHYYLSQQVHPVISRLCTPIEETDGAKMAECLGLDSNKFRAQLRAADDEFDDGYSGGSFALEDERSKCPSTESEDAVQTMATEPAIKHPPTNREYDVDEVIVADVFNPSC